MEILNSWLLYVISYLILATAFTQFYKIATKTLTKAGALTVLLEFMAGIIILILCPFFEMKFPTDIRVYISLGFAIIFYAITDRLNTTVRKEIEDRKSTRLNSSHDYRSAGSRMPSSA